MADVRTKPGTPVLADFTSTNGSPIVWDSTNALAYALADGDVITQIGGLSNVITAGSAGSSSMVPVITWDAKGRLLTVTQAAISGGGSVTGQSPITVSGGVVSMNNQGTSDTVLHGNAAGAPTFGKVNLVTDTTNYLPAGKGGTGTTSLTPHAVLLGNGSSALGGLVGSTNTVLHGNTGADPTFSAVVAADAPTLVPYSGATGNVDIGKYTIAVGGCLQKRSIAAGQTLVIPDDYGLSMIGPITGGAGSVVQGGVGSCVRID